MLNYIDESKLVLMNRARFKSLRGKMLLAMAVGMLLLFILLYFSASKVLLDGYAQLEKDKTIIQLDGAMSLIKEEADQLNHLTNEYGNWDDSYQFVKELNPNYLADNYNASSFANLKIKAVFILNADGKVLHQHGFDYTTGRLWAIPAVIKQATAAGGLLANPAKDLVSGLFWTPECVCLVSSKDILKNLGKGQRNGKLILIRHLDQTFIQKTEKILGVRLSIAPILQASPSDIGVLLATNKVITKPLDQFYTAGYTLLDSVDHHEKLVLSVVTDRKIYEQGKSNLKFLYVSVAVLALVLLAFSWLLDKLVLSRLANLNKDVKSIGHSTSTGERVKELGGEDEISSLTHGINHMLQRLDESQHELKFEKERAQATLAGIADAVISCDIAGQVLYMNAAAEQLTGLSAADAKGKTLQSLFHLLREDNITPVDSAWLTDTNSSLDEVALERADGKSFIISKSASALYDNQGQHLSNVIVLHDVTALRELSSQLSYQACHDQLTGLVNRYEFERKMQQAIEDTWSDGRAHCLAYFDLDQFKIVNDSCGHIAGDLLLQQLSELLKTKVRGSDTLARLGGDEFALLLTGCNLDKACTIIDSMLKIIREYRFNYDDKMFKVGCSIGLLEISPHSTLALDELLGMVDSACYLAKEQGGNRYHVYQPDGGAIKERNSQLEWISRIHTALEKNQFVLYAQQLQGFKAGAEAHCEVLVRMQGKDGALHPPGAFLPAAERYNLMPQIDRWVVNKALSVIASQGAAFTGVCAINLSGQSLSDDGFLDYIIEKIQQHGVNTSKICFEITETAAITNLSKARLFMQALRKIGCRFSLDDFGSGFSSFAYLKNLEVDFIKIDGLFIKSITYNAIDQTMVESINNLGHIMGLHTIAEFAENKETIQLLKEIGVDYAQGYGVSMPELFE